MNIMKVSFFKERKKGLRIPGLMARVYIFSYGENEAEDSLEQPK